MHPNGLKLYYGKDASTNNLISSYNFKSFVTFFLILPKISFSSFTIKQEWFLYQKEPFLKFSQCIFLIPLLYLFCYNCVFVSELELILHTVSINLLKSNTWILDYDLWHKARKMDSLFQKMMSLGQRFDEKLMMHWSYHSHLEDPKIATLTCVIYLWNQKAFKNVLNLHIQIKPFCNGA